MFTIKLAGLPIALEPQFAFTKQLCQEYLTEESPLFSLSVSRQEREAEEDGNGRFSDGYRESIAFYRKICAAVLPYGAFLLHAAVVAVDGQAYAFSAASGVGKTTHVRLWQQKFGPRCVVLNGDKPLLRVQEDRVMVYGTPWSGKEGENTNSCAPLKGLCFLERSEYNHISRLTDAQALPLLFPQVVMPGDETKADLLLGSLDRLLCTVPCYRLGCNPLPEAADVAWSAMAVTETKS